MASVVSIHRVETKNGPTEMLDAAPFIANFGLEGDWRSRKNRGRQITLIESEALEEIARVLKMSAIPAGASRRQVLVSGIDLNASVGKTLRVGPLLLKVDALCDPCRNMETMIGPDAYRAMKNRGGVCARVLEGGTLRPGDGVEIVADRPEPPGLFG